jgi:hypothetical protein
MISATSSGLAGAAAIEVAATLAEVGGLAFCAFAAPQVMLMMEAPAKRRTQVDSRISDSP